MSGWIVIRAGSEAQRTSDGGADGDDADKAMLDPDLLLLPRRLERLKVEEGEEMRDKICVEGWRLSQKMALFARPQRTRWEQV